MEGVCLNEWGMDDWNPRVCLYTAPQHPGLAMGHGSAGVLLVFNGHLLFRLKRKTTGERKVGLGSTVVASVGALILPLELLSRFLHR